MKEVDILVYNGDADSLAIYPADQEWIEHFKSIGHGEYELLFDGRKPETFRSCCLFP